MWKTVWGCLLVALLCAGTENTLNAAIRDGLANEARPESWKADASLADVTFVDRLHGWAVGSQGVLLRTRDGGETWNEGDLTSRATKANEVSLAEKFQSVRSRQQSAASPTGANGTTPFSCRFESVNFIDDKNGWAAGGYDLPWLDHSRAVIARTGDGGKTWQSLKRQRIGRIRKIEFRGQQRHCGWAIGANDPASKSSLLFTVDSGNIWSGQRSAAMPALLDAETAGQRFVGIDDQGQIVNFGTSKFQGSVITAAGDFFLRDLVMTSAKNGWAVGSNGAVLATLDGGLSWSRPPAEGPDPGGFDFRCVCATEDKIWFAGDPGDAIFSLDRQSGGLRVHSLPSGSAVNSICFVDNQFGWAVGDLGRIWSTRDAGEHWRLQRSGTSRVGVLVVCRDAEELPLEWIARQASGEGKLIAVVMERTRNFDSVRLALERIGAVLVVPLEGVTGEPSRLAKVARTIASLRPSVVLGNSTTFLRNAIAMAADPQARPEMVDLQNLNLQKAAWQVEILMSADANGPLRYANEAMLPQMGLVLEDLVLPSRMLCGLPIKAGPQSSFFAWRCLGGTPARFTQLKTEPLAQTKVPGRARGSLRGGGLAWVRRIGAKQPMMDEILNQPIESVLDVEACKQNIRKLTMSLGVIPQGDRLAGVWLLQLADAFLARGRCEQAAWCLETLARTYPEHCLTPLAAATLAKYYASSEQGMMAISNWQQLRNNIGQASPIAAEVNSGPRQSAIERTQFENGRTEYRWNRVDMATALEEAAAMPLDIDIEAERKAFDPQTVDLSLDIEAPETAAPPQSAPPVAPLSDVEKAEFIRQRHLAAASHFARLAGRDPGLAKRADFLFLQSHLAKQIGGFEDAKPYFQNVLKAAPDATYSAAARAEARNDHAAATKVIFASQRPHLDGLPNDPLWQEVLDASQSLKLEKRQGDLMNDMLMLARDDEYLYLYARCYRDSECSYAKRSDSSRQRDADLSHRDRIRISFDTDRDLVSSFDLQIDWRGEVHESCSGDKSWDPNMFVASHVDDRIWSLECAIAIDDLTDKLSPGDAWRLVVERKRRESGGKQTFWAREPRAGRLLQF